MLLAPSAAAQVRPLATHKVRPNVVVIVVDDIGLDQLRCYEDQNVYDTPYAYADTPNIDQLAQQGARFTQCRGSPLCSPSRAMLLSGRYAFRSGAGWLINSQVTSRDFLELGNPLPELTLPALLPGRREAVGKWHLGLESDEGGTMPLHPENLGFNAWRGTSRNFDDGDDPPGGPPGYFNFWWWVDGRKTQVQGVHATVHTASETLAVLPGLQRPFFLQVGFNACHKPMSDSDAPPLDQHGFGQIPPGFYNTVYRANLECLDRQLGVVLANLPPRTFVFLVGDNGSPLDLLVPAAGEWRYPQRHPSYEPGDESTQLSLAPYSGGHGKQTPFEGGIRVPLIVWGPDVLPGTRTELIDLVDLYATICALRGVHIPAGIAQDSSSFAGVLTGGAGLRNFSFTEQFRPNGVADEHVVEDRTYVRQDGPHLWKLIRRLLEPDQFFDVATDPLEVNDLGTGHPEYQATVDAMLALLAS